MRGIWAVPIIVSILILGTLTIFPIQEVEAAPGDYIVTNLNGQSLFRITPEGVLTVIDIAPVFPLGGLAIDSAGDYIVTDWIGESSIVKITPEGTIFEITSSDELDFPNAIAIDSDGNYIVGDYFASRLLKVTPAGVVSEIVTHDDLGTINDIIVDSDGNYIVISDDHTGALVKVTPAGVVSVISGGNHARTTVAIDSAGDYFIPDSFVLRKITPAGGVTNFLIASEFSDPNGVVIDSSGNFIVAAQFSLLSVTPDGSLSVIVDYSRLRDPYVEIEPIPDLSCGSGTEKIDRRCLPDFAQICGSGTTQVGDECVALSALSCGDGTIPQGNECVVDPSLIQELEDALTAALAELTPLQDELDQALLDLGNALADLAAALTTITELELPGAPVANQGEGQGVPAPVENQGEGQGVPAQGKNNKP